MTEQFLTDVMTLVSDEDLDLEHLFPRVRDGVVHLVVNCNDFFYWGTADAEELVSEDLPMLRQCIDDLSRG